MVLTARQTQDLHNGILDYLQSAGFTTTAEAFAAEGSPLPGPPKSKGQLEKKWTAVVRQQKKIMELEKRLKQVEEELASGGGGGGGGSGGTPMEELLPKPQSDHSMEGHREAVTCVAFHPSFNVLVSASEDATIRQWDSESGEYEKTLKGHTNVVNDVAFSHDGKLLASASADFTVKLWSFEAGRCAKTMKGHEHNVSGVAFTSIADSSEQVLSCSRDETIKLWDPISGYCVRTYTGHGAWVRRVVPRADGLTMASCSDDTSVRIWNISTGKELQAMSAHEHVIETIEWLNPAAVEVCVASDEYPDVRQAKGVVHALLLSASRDKTIKLWDAASGACLKVFAGHDNWVRRVRCHPGGKFFLSCSDDKSVRVWDLRTGRNTKTIANAHSHFVTALDVHRGMRRIATGSVDKTVALFGCR